MMTTGNHGEVDIDICHNFYDYNDSCDSIHHRVMIDDIDWWSGLIMERIDVHDCWGLIEYIDEWWLVVIDHDD